MNKFLLILILFVLPLFAFSDEAKSNDFIYVFHLYYDNGQLVADRDFEFKYDVVPELFVPETINTQFPFKGEIVNLNGQVTGTFMFDPRRGDPSFLKGKISVKAPYASDGNTAAFYDAQGNKLLTIFVSESSFCNDDGVCNVDNGEDTNTCPADCKAATPVPVAPPDAGGGGQGGMLMNLVYVLIILGAGLGGWYGWKWWQRKKSSTTEMPFIPPTI